MEDFQKNHSWLTKALAQRSDLSTNSGGMGGGDMAVSGPQFDGMASLFQSKGKKNVHKKKRRRLDERPGEQKLDKMQ